MSKESLDTQADKLIKMVDMGVGENWNLNNILDISPLIPERRNYNSIVSEDITIAGFASSFLRANSEISFSNSSELVIKLDEKKNEEIDNLLKQMDKDGIENRKFYARTMSIIEKITLRDVYDFAHEKTEECYRMLKFAGNNSIVSQDLDYYMSIRDKLFYALQEENGQK